MFIFAKPKSFGPIWPAPSSGTDELVTLSQLRIRVPLNAGHEFSAGGIRDFFAFSCVQEGLKRLTGWLNAATPPVFESASWKDARIIAQGFLSISHFHRPTLVFWNPSKIQVIFGPSVRWCRCAQPPAEVPPEQIQKPTKSDQRKFVTRAEWHTIPRFGCEKTLKS